MLANIVGQNMQAYGQEALHVLKYQKRTKTPTTLECLLSR
jgi:hypothetical protein